MNRMLPLLLSMLLVATPSISAEQPVQLASGWLIAKVEIQPDGSTRVLKLIDNGPVPGIDLRQQLEAVTFPPHKIEGRAVTYETGMYLRVRVLQVDGRRQLDFGTTFLTPVIWSYPSRPWPENAWEEGLGGEVILAVEIDSDGEVSKVERVGGDAPTVFDEVAHEVAVNTVFTPPRADGDAVASSAIMDIYYEPRSRKKSRKITPATVRLPGGEGEENPDPLYHEDLASWAQYTQSDRILRDALDGWDLSEEARAEGSIKVSLVNRRLVIPSEGRFLLLPDLSQESRDAVIN